VLQYDRHAPGAVIFAKTNAAKYHGDPTRVAMMGDSAGGNISSMCALCWDNPYFKPSFTGDGKVTAQTQANVFLFGVFDLVTMYNMMGWYVIFENPKEIGKMYMGGTPAEMLDRYKMASPVTHVRKDMSPTLLVCGGADPLFEQSNLFHRKLDETGIRSGFYISIGDTHGFTALTTKGAADAYNAVNAFLALELKRLGATPATPSKK
jgi:acetyl esterase/lipase